MELQGGSLTYHYHSCDDHASTKIYNKWSVTFHEDVVSVGDVFVFCPWKIKVISKQSWSLKFLFTKYVYVTWLMFLSKNDSQSQKSRVHARKLTWDLEIHPLKRRDPFWKLAIPPGIWESWAVEPLTSFNHPAPSSLGCQFNPKGWFSLTHVKRPLKVLDAGPSRWFFLPGSVLQGSLVITHFGGMKHYKSNLWQFLKDFPWITMHWLGLVI